MDASGENIRVIGGLLASNPVWEDFGPLWSPDSSRLAYIDKSSSEYLGQVFVVDVDTGEPRQITYNPYRSADPDWSPDGERIAFAGGTGNEWHLYVVNEDGSAQKQLTTYRSYPFMRDLAWSPHDDHIAFTSPGKDGRDAEFSWWRPTAALFGTSPTMFTPKIGSRSGYRMEPGLATQLTARMADGRSL